VGLQIQCNAGIYSKGTMKPFYTFKLLLNFEHIINGKIGLEI